MSRSIDVWTSRVVVLGIHLACFAAIWVGVSWTAALVCAVSYLLRGFGITAGYHRLFSHRSYRAHPVFRTILGILGVSAVQGCPLKWAKEHRHHHDESDQPEDLHSPKHPSFWWAHIGWIWSSRMPTIKRDVKDLRKEFPELYWVGKLQAVILLGFVAGLYFLGEWLGAAYGTSGFQLVVWGFFISTVMLWHATWAVNSVVHTFGSRRWETTDDSRNNWLIGIVALGEGHHNNHHHSPGLVRQGLLWWEFDPTYYVIKGLSLIPWLRITYDLNEPEPEVFDVARSLSKIRSQLERRKLCESAIEARMKEGQGILAQAVRSMASLRKQISLRMIDPSQVMERLRQAAESFRQSLRTAEALALA